MSIVHDVVANIENRATAIYANSRNDGEDENTQTYGSIMCEPRNLASTFAEEDLVN